MLICCLPGFVRAYGAREMVALKMARMGVCLLPKETIKAKPSEDQGTILRKFNALSMK